MSESADQQIARLEAELSAAKWAAEHHLQTVLAQQKIIIGQAMRLAELQKEK